MTFREKVIKALDDVDIDPETGCWVYQGNIDPLIKYGRIQIDGERYHTHRLSAYIYLGLDLTDWRQFACHKCDNRRCCNPEHLYVGDNKSNQRDFVKDTCKRGHDITINPIMHRRANGTYFRECRLCTRLRNSKKKG